MIAFDRKEFGKRIQSRLRTLGISRPKFAKKIGVTYSSLFAYSKGNAIPSVELAYYIAQALGVSVDWLCGAGEGRKPHWMKKRKRPWPSF